MVLKELKKIAAKLFTSKLLLNYMISSISTSAVTGIQRGLQQTTEAASKIAIADRDIDLGNLTENMVDLKMGQRQVEVSAMVIKVDDQLRGTILDIKA